MLLKEFFGKAIDIDKELAKTNNDQGFENDLFWFIIDHDKLHKDYFHPIAAKIHKLSKSDNLDKAELIKEFLPMARKGCQEFYVSNKLPGHFEDNFSKELLKELCEKLYNHYANDIINDKHYMIGVN